MMFPLDLNLLRSGPREVACFNTVIEKERSEPFLKLIPG